MVYDLLFPRTNRLQKVFYFMIACAIIGPALGIKMDSITVSPFRIAFFVLVGGIILRVVMDKSYLRLKNNLERNSVYQIRWYFVFFAFWVMYAVLSISWAINTYAALRYIVYLSMMILLALSFPFFATTEKKMWRTFQVLFWVFVAIVYFGVFESIAEIHLPSSAVYGKISASVTSVFHNQNDFATCITLTFPFLICALFMLDLKKKHKWFIYITGVFTLYVLLATGSRSNTFFALPLASVVLIIGLPFVIERTKITRRNLLRAFLAVVVAIIVAASMSTVFLSAQARELVQEKLSSTFLFLIDIQKGGWSADEDGSEVIEGESGQSPTVRKFLILNGLKFLQESNFIGVGAGNVETWMKNAPHVNKTNMHNWWMEVLVNFGVIVFVLYMALYFGLLGRLWKLASLKTSPHSSKILRWSAFACLSSLIGFFFGGMAPSSCIHFTPMWITFGIGLAIVAFGELQKRQQAKAKM